MNLEQTDEQFYEATIAFYRGLLLKQLQTKVYRAHKTGLFAALRQITEWQRTEDRSFKTFYALYRAIEQAQNELHTTPAKNEAA